MTIATKEKPAATSNRYDQPLEKRSTTRTVSFKVVVISFVLIAVVGISLHYLHGYQHDRLAATFKDQALRSEELGETDKAAGYLFQYLKLRPHDRGAHVYLAELYDDGSTPRKRARSIELYYRAIGLSPDSLDLRYRLIELLLDSGRYGEARTQAENILAITESNRRADRFVALAALGQINRGAQLIVPRVQELLLKAIESNPTDSELAVDTAVFLREKATQLAPVERTHSANEIMDELVGRTPDSVDSLMARYQYRMKYDVENAAEDLEHARNLSPEHPLVLEALATQHLERQEYELAQQIFAELLAAEPANARMWERYGRSFAVQGDLQRAIEIWKEGFSANNQADLSLGLHIAQAELALQNYQAADQQLDRIKRIQRQVKQSLMPADAARINSLISLLEGQLDLAQKRPATSAIHLRRAISGFESLSGGAGQSAESVKAHYLLGMAYGHLTNWDMAALEFEQAATLQPTLTEARVAAGEAWQHANRPELAIAQFDVALSIKRTPDVLLARIEADLKRLATLPGDRRKWSVVEQGLSELSETETAEQLSKPWRLPILEARVSLLKSGQRDSNETASDITRILTNAEAEFEKQAEFWHEAALIYGAADMADSAQRMVDQYEALVGKSSNSVILRAQLLHGRGEDKLALATLDQALNFVPKESAKAILLTKATILAESDQQHNTIDLQDFKVEGQLRKLPLLIHLANLATQAKNWPQVQSLVEQMQDLEGSTGTNWKYFQGVRLLSEKAPPTNASLIAADELTSDIERTRPEWANGHVLRAKIALMRNDVPTAIESLKRAIENGGHRLSIYENLIVLLYQTQDFIGANRYLSLLETKVPSSRMLSAVAIPMEAKTGNMAHAIEVARAGVETRPRDPFAYIWLGQLLNVSGNPAEAEKTFQQAVDVGPNDLVAWNGLFSFYLRAERLEEARQTLADMESKAKLKPGHRELALAQGNVLLNDYQSADKHFRRAIKLAPRDANAHIQFAAFLLKNDVVEAERVLRKVVYQLDPEAGIARRMLAAILASRGTREAWDEIAKLLDERGTDLDAKFQAILLARRGGRQDIIGARQILERQRELTSSDRILLAQLYEREAKFSDANKQYLSVVSQDDVPVGYLMSYIEFLLRSETPAHADVWLDKLAERDPDSLSYLIYRARFLKLLDRSSEIAELVEPVANRMLEKQEDSAKYATVMNFAKLYYQVDQFEMAEKWLQRMEVPTPKQSELLAISVARQGNTAEAFAMCQELLEANSSEDWSASLSRAVAAIASLGKVSPADRKHFIGFLREQSQRFPKNAVVLSSLANAYLVSQDRQLAVETYKLALEHDPNSISTLNNLAAVMLENSEDTEEALSYIDRAISLAGKHPALLDTKGTILIQQSELAKAIEILESAVHTGEHDPRYPFHLASALLRSGDLARADEIFTPQVEISLADEVLTDFDKTLLQQLQSSLR